MKKEPQVITPTQDFLRGKAPKKIYPAPEGDRKPLAKTTNDGRRTTNDERRITSFEDLIARAPHCPGVYKMHDAAGALLYVGKAKDLTKRLKQYIDADKLEYHKILMRRQVARVDWFETATEAEALILEQHSIKTEKPKYNIIFKDDKMYPFLELSKGPFPRLFKFRGKIVRKRDVFGPFPFVSDLMETIKLVQRICQIRTCSDSYMKAHKKRPCLMAQVGLCLAPCAVAQTRYKDHVRMARNILCGHVRLVISDLTKKMKAAAASQDFESAAKFRGQILSLQLTTKTARLEPRGKKK